METTDWFDPQIKPVHIGWYESRIFDCGWPYEWRIWWDGSVWRDAPRGWALHDQHQQWRGKTEAE